MTIEIFALAIDVMISILLPFIVLGAVIYKNKERRKSLVILFLCGGLCYITMQWGIKEHGLTWLFNNTDFINFMKNHYIPYLLLVAFVGGLLTVLAQMLVVNVFFRQEITFTTAVSLGLGYNLAESTMLMGYRSFNTIIELIKGTEMELDTSVTELFLSGYERLLILMIEVTIVAALCYFVEWKKPIQGGIIAVFCYTMLSFIPGFFIAFSLPDYYEVFDRSTTLLMVYIILTASAFASIVISNFLRNKLKD